MKQQTLKALTNAHAWVGLVISTILFLVFLGGSFSLFRENIVSWERDTLYSQSKPQVDVGLDVMVNNVYNQYEVDQHHPFYIRFPEGQKSHFEVYFAEEDENGNEIDFNLLVSSETGEILTPADRFIYGDFLYDLHVDLHLGELGKYLVGFVTLFFFVAVLSGVVIHWRKIVNNFFQYRKDGKKDKWLDAHNLIGVMGLPYHIMYAFTGLVFNLVIIYQIAYAVLLYQADQNALLADAGYVDTRVEMTGVAQPIDGLQELYERAQNELGSVNINFANIQNIGDETSTIRFSGNDPELFSTRKEIEYVISSGEVSYKTLDNFDNDVRSGLAIIASLHFADFAGYGLRLLFFVLGIGTCYLILTGNLMWIEKRAKQRKHSVIGLHIVKALSTGVFVGSLVATAVGFVLARILPPQMAERSDMIFNAFFITMFVCLAVAFVYKNQQVLSVLFLRITSILMVSVPLLDWIYVSEGINELLVQGRLDVLVVESIAVVFAVCCWVISRHMSKSQQAAKIEPVQSDEEPVPSAA